MYVAGTAEGRRLSDREKSLGSAFNDPSADVIGVCGMKEPPGGMALYWFGK